MPSFARGAWLAVASVLIVPAALSQTTVKGSIEGDVVDVSTGKGIPGARVRIQAAQDEPLVVAADESGHFRFDGLPLNSYEVRARYPGYITARAGRENAPEIAILTPRFAAADVRLKMRSYGAIVGKVTDALGLPVDGVSVWVYRRSTSDASRRVVRDQESALDYVFADMTRTDDLGEYRFAPLAAGSYFIEIQTHASRNMRPIRPPDTRERTTYYPSALKLADAKPIPVSDGKESRADVHVISETGVKVSGRVHGAVGADISFHVSAVPEMGVAVSALTAGDSFTFVDLLPGKYVLEAGEYIAGDVLMQTPVASGARTLEIGKEDVADVEINLAATPDVRGILVFENGCTAVPVRIQLQSGRRVRDFHISTAGDFVMPHLFPDNYKMYVRPDSQPYSSAISATLGEADVLKDGFKVAPDTTGPLRITMSCRK
jgi:carboxypeptidase family protein